MTAMLAGRVAIVTGAATGIGSAIARRLAADGASVVVSHLNTPDAAQSVCAQITQAGGVASEFGADISVRAEHEALVAAAIKRYGGWNILVANAAVAPTKALVEFTPDEIDRVLAVNVKGLVWGLQLAATRMADGGRIIALSSSTTGLHQPGYTVYDASKGAVDQLIGSSPTRSATAESPSTRWRPERPRPRRTQPGEERSWSAASLPCRRSIGSARWREIADVVAYLAGDGARWITGQTIRANGGTV